MSIQRNLSTNLEIKVKAEIKNIMNSIEYLSEALRHYKIFNKGFIEGQKTNIIMLEKQLDNNNKQISYLQGNNSKYGIDIVQLKDNIKNEIKTICNEEEEIISNIPMIHNICKLNNEKICEIIDKNFYKFLSKN